MISFSSQVSLFFFPDDLSIVECVIDITTLNLIGSICGFKSNYVCCMKLGVSVFDAYMFRV